MNPKIIVICILFSALAQTCVYCDSFDPKMVHLVDFDNGNFFFRCNEPKINGTFVPETLVGVMKEVLKGTELVFPEDYYLHDVNVLTPFTKLDYGDILLEKNYFKAHPERGNFYSFPITGSIEAPWLYSPEKQYQDSLTFDTWDFDELTKRTELVGELMGKFGNAKEQDKPNVVFVHCEEGKDRTGEFSGAYEMRYLKQNLQQVADHDQQIAGRPIFPNFSNHLVWYCMYLKYKVGYTIDYSKQKVGDQIEINGKKGVIKYIGVTKLGEGVWYGIELDKSEGDNNGTIKKTKYFECEPKHGIFLPEKEVLTSGEIPLEKMNHEQLLTRLRKEKMRLSKKSRKFEQTKEIFEKKTKLIKEKGGSCEKILKREEKKRESKTLKKKLNN